MILEDAAPAETPPRLLRPPWIAREAPLLPIVEGLGSLPFEPLKGMSDGERARHAKPPQSLADLRGYNLVPKHLEPQTPEMDAFVVARLRKPTRFGVSYLDLLTEPAARAYLEEHGVENLLDDDEDDRRHIIARFGAWAVEALERHGIYGAEAFIASTETAEGEVEGALAEWSPDRTLELPEYLARFPEVAAIVLLPMALSGKDRTAVLTLLQALSQRSLAPLQEVARRFGPAAQEALLAYPVSPRKPPLLPDWADPGVLPPVEIAAAPGKRLPEGATRHLTRLLAMRAGDDWPEAEAWLREVSGALTRESLAAFVLGLFEAWIAAGTPASGEFALQALGWFGDDAAARALAVHVRVWADAPAGSSAAGGLNVLRAIGTSVALAYVDDIAARTRDWAACMHAHHLLDGIAALRDLPRAARRDVLAPTLGLDPEGSLLLSFGPRSFRVELDEELTPFVRDDRGELRPDLPIPARGDDPALAAAAVRSWQGLKTDARELAGHQIQRLEAAMVDGRRWTSREFLDRIVGHPFLVHFARRLVWAVFSGDRPAATFHAAADRSLRGPEGAPFTLPEGASVGVVHPLDLDPALLERYEAVFEEQDILQPFPQIERELYAVEAAEAGSTSLTRFDGQVVSAVDLLGLSWRGWSKGSHEDERVRELHRPLPGDLLAVLPISEGYEEPKASRAPPQELGPLEVHRIVPGQTWTPGPPVPLDALPRRVFSELVHDLASLGGWRPERGRPTARR